MADNLKEAREQYIAARDALDALWPRYERTLALEPLTPGQPAPEVSADDRAVAKEWATATDAFTVALAELRRWAALED